jgi:PadR family transcriptional regulator PadR
MTPKLNLLVGTLELLVLQTLAARTERHGFEILVEEGALYPALHRMERRGWLASDWATSDKGRRAKYYHLTARGRRALAKTQAEWQRYVAAMARVAAQAARR